jgi:hypothetical protein
VAFVYKSGTVAEPRSALARVSFDRQKDAFRLARMGSGDMRRLWADFEASSPGMARLVRADCASDDAEAAKVTRGLDKRLARAEKMVTKSASAKPKKLHKVRSRAAAAAIEKSLRVDAAYEAVLRSEAVSADPVAREAARALLAAM